VRDTIEGIHEAGAEVVVICMSGPKNLRAYLSGADWPFIVLGDPERIAYRAFGLERTGWGRFFRWSVLRRYLALIWGGWRVRSPYEGEDLLQLGGDFILTRSFQLGWMHRSLNPTERPSITVLLEAIREAKASGGGKTEQHPAD